MNAADATGANAGASAGATGPGAMALVGSGEYLPAMLEIERELLDDLRESRLYLVDPAPIPADELQRTYEWMKSWDFLETAPCAANLVA